MLRTLFKFFVLLNSETSPWQLAFGAALGMVLGLTPLWSLHNVLVLFLLLLLRVNISFALLSMALCAGLAYGFDNQFHALGWQVLNAPMLQDLFNACYNIPLLRWAQFNNTVVLGSLLVSVILFLPFAVLVRIGISAYRRHWQARFEQLKIVQLLKASRWYEALSRMETGA